jgi:hypothetical protein
MVNIESKFIGYFPKKNDYENPAVMVDKWRDSLRAAGVTEIGSVSECIRSGPEGWIDLWKHNELGFYDSEDVVLTVIKGHEDQYTIFAYKLYLVCYEDGETKTGGKMIARANQLNVTENLKGYQFIGFDVASCSLSDFFECSALSCNNAFEEYEVNEYCLLSDPALARRAHKEISAGNYEPGEQYLLEVYRKIKPLTGRPSPCLLRDLGKLLCGLFVRGR